jgi:hypothetical protein
VLADFLLAVQPERVATAAIVAAMHSASRDRRIGAP